MAPGELTTAAGSSRAVGPRAKLFIADREHPAGHEEDTGTSVNRGTRKPAPIHRHISSEGPNAMPRTRLRLAAAVTALVAGIVVLLPVGAGGGPGAADTTTASGATTLPAGNAQWG